MMTTADNLNISSGLTTAGTATTAAEPVSSELRQITAQPSMQQA